MSGTYKIIVGVDGSEGGERALRWAAAEAVGRGATVLAVGAWSWDGLERVGVTAENPAVEREQTSQSLADTVTKVAADHPGVDIGSETIEGPPAVVLAKAARDANLLVLGSHGHSRLRHAVLGSVSEECVRTATCPVVVVPVPHDREPDHDGASTGVVAAA